MNASGTRETGKETDVINTLARRFAEDIIAIRRDLHRHPELSWREERTTQQVSERLAAMGIEVEFYQRTGVTGELKGHHGGPVVALRADLDALALTEQTDLPFQSSNGAMHACGHDCHTAMLLGAARILSHLRHRLRGTVRFVFQPAEELAEGARYLLGQGALGGVESIFGLHVCADLPTGTINLDPGARMAATDTVQIVISPVGRQDSAQAAAAAVIMELQPILSRYSDPRDAALSSLGRGRITTRGDTVLVEGSCRSFADEMRRKLHRNITRRAMDIASKRGCRADVAFSCLTPPVMNDPRLTHLAREAAAGVVGTEGLVSRPVSGGGEDFAFYQDLIPGTFAFLGCGGDETPRLPHSERFVVDERALPLGAALYAAWALTCVERAA